MIDTLIIGAGPAGLSAAVYSSRAGLSTLIVTGESKGGLLLTTEEIDNYLGLPNTTGAGMAELFVEHALKFGAEIKRATVESIESSEGTFATKLSTGELILSKTVIFAAGSTPRKLGVSGEELSGVSYCATCDGGFYEDEDVVVVGGGETAVEDALYLTQMASSVHVLVRGNTWRATAPAVEKLVAHPKVTVLMEESVKAVNGESEVESITLESGKEIQTNGLFIAVGQSPNSHTASKHVTLFEDGFIAKSLVPGFFIAGDIGTPEHRQVAVAVGDGAKAGIDATRFVLGA